MPIWALVEHRGRRSAACTARLAIRPIARGVAIPIAYGIDADWTRNIFAAGGCAILWQDQRYDATDPSLVDAREGLAPFHPIHRALVRMSGVELVLLLTTTAAREMDVGRVHTQ